MITIILLVVMGLVICAIGMWLSFEAMDRLNGFLGVLGFLIGLAIACGGVVLSIWLGGGFDGPSDPCQHLVSVRPILYEHYKGWINYGGRPVWCGPGAPH